MGMGSELCNVFKKVVHLVPKQFQLKIYIVSTLPDLPNQKDHFLKKYTETAIIVGMVFGIWLTNSEKVQDGF